jgi:hypothetical protein
MRVMSSRIASSDIVNGMTGFNMIAKNYQAVLLLHMMIRLIRLMTAFKNANKISSVTGFI